MKHVVSSDMVAHLWANQSQDHARNATDSFYFRDTTIYSYGSHFPIARHVKGIVLFTNRSYSNTTAKHLSKTRRAINHLTVLECYNPKADTDKEHKSNLFEMREACYTTLTKAARARSNAEWLFNRAEELAATHTDYRKLFGLELDEPLVISEEWNKKAQGRIAAQSKVAKAQREHKAKLEEARNVELAKELEEWKTDTSIIYRTFCALPVALRRVETKSQDIVQTSHGASIPTAHALRLWSKVKAIKESGIAYRRNGHTEYAGAFAVDSIESDGTMKAGCHTIKFDAMEELANRLGW